jgi:hypothetical protein
MYDSYFYKTLNDIKKNDPEKTRVSFPCDRVEPLDDTKCQIIIEALKNNDYVKTFFLGSNEITRAGLKDIWETKIERLNISFMDIEEGVVDDLIKMQNLKLLDIEGTKVDKPEDFKTIIENLPKLETLIIGSELYQDLNLDVNKQLKIIFNHKVIDKPKDEKLEDSSDTSV